MSTFKFRELFVDCLVTTGSNPTVLLLTELIESGAISATQAEWAIMSLGYYIKTPTFDLLRHLMVKTFKLKLKDFNMKFDVFQDFIRSDAVQTLKNLRQTAYKSMADLLNSACAPLAFRKYTSPPSGRYCTKDQFQLFQKDLVPLLVQELDGSEGVDRMSALTNIGLLASEDTVAVLLPHIRGNGSGGDVAYRTRAILSLHDIFHKIPERVYPLLLALADNIAERPEVRMAAISILLNVQVPINVWQRVASRTWFEPNQQVRAFIYNMIVSYTRLNISTPTVVAL